MYIFLTYSLIHIHCNISDTKRQEIIGQKPWLGNGAEIALIYRVMHCKVVFGGELPF